VAATRKPNVPAEWDTAWPSIVNHQKTWWPIDGRETIYEPYERFASTTTVGELRSALARVAAGDPALPADFASYLRQRCPTDADGLPDDTSIDERGRFSK
jgi:hypothetical protein